MAEMVQNKDLEKLQYNNLKTHKSDQVLSINQTIYIKTGEHEFGAE